MPTPRVNSFLDPDTDHNIKTTARDNGKKRRIVFIITVFTRTVFSYLYRIFIYAM